VLSDDELNVNDPEPALLLLFINQSPSVVKGIMDSRQQQAGENTSEVQNFA
jgi:hypothetical protein